MSPLRPVPPDRLADRLHEACYACGCSDLRIPLTSLATANMMLGTPCLATPALRVLSDPAREGTAVSWTRRLWESTTRNFPYLEGRIGALTDWLDQARDHEVKALESCFGMLAGYDVEKSVDQVGGDLLGPVYILLRGKRAQQDQGAFYTPEDVSALALGLMGAESGGAGPHSTGPGSTGDDGGEADGGYVVGDGSGERLLARLAGLREDSSVSDDCCGTGGMIVATIRGMRDAGQDPDTCMWELNDLDPLAVAMAGVNMASCGMTRVSLLCGNTLLWGTGDPGDPLRSRPTGRDDRGEAA